MSRKNFFLAFVYTLIVFSMQIDDATSQIPYYQIDGYNCDVNGNSPEWGTPYATDPNDAASGGSDIKTFWVNYDTISQQYCFAFERFDDGGGPTSTFSIFFDVDCDLNDGGSGPQQGAELGFGFRWTGGNSEDVERFERGSNASTIVATALFGESVCGSNSSDGTFAEFCITLDDIISATQDGYFDPCNCDELTLTGAASLAGGSFSSAPKDRLDFDDLVDKINEVPIAVLESLPSEICLGQELIYSGINSYDTFPYSGETMDYFWDFDYDGITVNAMSTDTFGTYTYANPGLYDIAFMVVDTFGCSDTLFHTISVIEDFALPTITCPSNQSVSANAICEALLPDYTEDAIVDDNCTDPSLITVIQDPLPGTTISATTTITLTAFDEEGNQESCTFDVTVIDDSTIGFTIACPVNDEVSADANCEAVLLDYTDQAVVNDNCTATEDIVVTQVPAPGTVISGTTTVTLTATDLSGNQVSCTFDVTVIDDLMPAIICPVNQNIIADVNCEAIVPDFRNLATVTDNCSVPANISISQNPLPGSIINATSTITLTIQDESGNTNSCSFELIVDYCQAEVCGHLYNDINGNGTQDAGEPDLPAVDVIVTDANGNQYTVTSQIDPDGDLNGVWCITVPPGTITIDVDETDPDFLIGSTQTEGDDPTIITVVGGQINDGGTDGYSIYGSVCGHLYMDVNGNGTQDGTEPDLANLNVVITDANGAVQTVISDSDGNYCADVPPGPIEVNVDETDADFPAGSTQTEGDDPTMVNAILGQTVDAGNDGYSIYGEVCGHLYNDINGNGTQDLGEPDLPNVDVIITDGNGVIYTVTTQVDPDGDLNGIWCVSVPPGTVTVDVDETDSDFPTGSTQTEGDDPTVVNAISGQTVDGGTDGYSIYGSVCGHLYLDSNSNGIQDLGEPDLPNVDIIITDNNGTIQIVSSDIDGNYCADVPPGPIEVNVDETDPDFPTGSIQTEGDDPTIVTAVLGQEIDAGNDGYTMNGEVCGLLYYDTNENGVQDVGEPAMPLIDVIITHSNGTVYTATTQVDPDGDLNGVWCITIPQGSITVDVDETDPDFPYGAEQTEGDDPTTLLVLPGQLVDGGTDGYYVSPGVCGRVFYDTNGNGIMDAGEPGIPNIDVTIADESNAPFIVVTDQDGNYCTEVIPGGVFINVMVDDPDFPIGAVQSQGLNPNYVVVPSDGGYVDGGTDGYIIQSVTCGTIYNDSNGNGVQDGSEFGIAAIDVIITDANGDELTIESDADGNWCATVPEGATTIYVDVNDPDFPSGGVQTEGDNPNTITTINGQSTNGGNDGFQICVSPQLKIFLEGSLIFASGNFQYHDEMRTSLNDLRILPGQLKVDPFFGNSYTPAGQPYTGAPWFYNGAEGDAYDSQGVEADSDAAYPADVVDWVLVSLRENENKSSEVCKAAGLLHKDGTIELMESFECCGLEQSQMFIVVEHRNHLIVMTPEKVAIEDGMLEFDFTQNDSYKDFFGLGIGQKLITSDSGNQYYVMYGGNGDQQTSSAADTDINVNDKVIWEDQNNQFGVYKFADFNLSGDTNVNDKSLWQMNNNLFSSVPN